MQINSVDNINLNIQPSNSASSSASQNSDAVVAKDKYKTICEKYEISEFELQ